MALAQPATRASLKSALKPRRIVVLATLCLTLAGILPGPAAGGWVTWNAPALTVPADSEAGRILAIASGQLHDKFRMGAIGPREFDCSGFVFYVFREAGLVDRIGNKRKGATAYRDWFAARGWRSNGDLSKAQPGDILIWSGGHHAGIYLGNNWAISALINPWGISIHRPLKIDQPLTDVLHVQMSRGAGSYNGPSPSSSPSPTPTPDPNATPTPTPDPNATPTPTATPSAAPTNTPASTPAAGPTPTSSPQSSGLTGHT